MPDIVNSEKRSLMMANIKGVNTRPEKTVRSLFHKQGFRYLIHNKKLAGRPDLTFPKYKAVVFVNGCFWHGHNCSLFKWPSSNIDFWKKKISDTKRRDLQNLFALNEGGWKILIIWECALKGKQKIDINILSLLLQEWLLNKSTNEEITGL